MREEIVSFESELRARQTKDTRLISIPSFPLTPVLFLPAIQSTYQSHLDTEHRFHLGQGYS